MKQIKLKTKTKSNSFYYFLLFTSKIQKRTATLTPSRDKPLKYILICVGVLYQLFLFVSIKIPRNTKLFKATLSHSTTYLF